LDVGLAAAATPSATPTDAAAAPLLADVQAALPDFFNPDYGLIQNSGPLLVTGSQGRGDTWYELEHAIKAAELGLLGTT
jgi:hypothetical protein